MIAVDASASAGFLVIQQHAASTLNSESNYYKWKILMEALLVWRGLLEYVDGSKSKPVGSPNSKVIKDFMKRLAEACIEIVLHVETLQLTHVCDHDPTTIWKTLETVHCACGFATCLMLHHKFLTLHKSDEKSIQAWVIKVCCVTLQLLT